VTYNGALVRFAGLERQNTLSQDWPFFDAVETAPGTLRIDATPQDGAIPSGTLCRVRFLVLSGDGTPDDLAVGRTTLHFTDPAFRSGVGAILTDGAIITSGACILPLKSDKPLLMPVRPNPFNPSTTVEFTVPAAAEGAHVALDVVDAYGRVVHRMYTGPVTAGTHTLRFDAAGLPSGLYFCRFESGGTVQLQKMLLTR
jgi:hypothetical protein